MSAYGNNLNRLRACKLKYEGMVFKTNSFGDVKILVYENSKSVLVKFLNSGCEVVCRLDKILQGKLKDPQQPSVYGVGIVGDSIIRCEGKLDKAYVVWSNMLKRCYDLSSTKSRPTYKDCIVSDNFKYLENFKEWCNNQVGFGLKDENGKSFALDKDILVKGNKVYSPETCCFVPPEINSLILKRCNDRGFCKIGVSLHKQSGKYKATLNVFGCNVYLGVFNTEQEAFLVYKKAKESHIKTLALKWKSSIDKRVFEKLMNYEVSDDD